MTNSFSPQDFITQMQTGRIATTIGLTGIVKMNPDRESSLVFSASGECQNWIPVPTEWIETVEYLGESVCRDHSHPLVKLHIRQPDSKDAIGSFLGHILKDLIDQLELQDESEPLPQTRFRPSACYVKCIRRGETPRRCKRLCKE